MAAVLRALPDPVIHLLDGFWGVEMMILPYKSLSTKTVKSVLREAGLGAEEHNERNKTTLMSEKREETNILTRM